MKVLLLFHPLAQTTVWLILIALIRFSCFSRPKCIIASHSSQSDIFTKLHITGLITLLNETYRADYTLGSFSFTAGNTAINYLNA